MLIAEILAHGRKQSLAPVAGMPGRQPPPMISSVNRPHITYLTSLDIHHRDPFTTLRTDCAPGNWRDDHAPDGTVSRHTPMLAASTYLRQTPCCSQTPEPAQGMFSD